LKQPQSVLDALADAETLEAMARLLARFDPTYDLILDADCTVWIGAPDRIAGHVTSAFAAVPALRAAQQEEA
jgi:hypothetical protein